MQVGRSAAADRQADAGALRSGHGRLSVRERGVPVYGVYPYPVSRSELTAMHGNGERISVKRLEEGTDMLSRVLREVAAR